MLLKQRAIVALVRVKVLSKGATDIKNKNLCYTVERNTNV